ncbi:MAG: translocation/assembly module TamB [Gemmatimonadetes bacterium]|nr:translocation/assembly module TamB [Gemmatimonadota bacterium]
MDLRPPFAVQGLRAELRKLDLALFAALRPELRLGGSITGRIEATGRLDQSLRFAAALEHQRAGAPASQLEGRGALQWGADRTVDARFDARPLALDALAAIFPQLGRVTGELHGPVTIQGPLHDLAVKAEVATPGGPVVLEARLDLARPEPHYRAAGSVTDFLLDRVAKGLPATTITGRFFLEGAGTEASRARGVLKASLERGRVRDLDVSDGVLALTIAEGAARVDTFALESDAGRLFARGQLGLVAERRGELDLELDADSLGALRSFFFADTAGLPLEGKAARLAGALRLHARLEGGLAGFDVHAQASLQHLVYDRIRARRATIQLGATAVRSDSLRLRLSLRSDSLALYDRPLLAARLEAQYGDSAGQLEIEADAPDQQAYRLATDFHRAGGRAEFRLRELGLRTGPASWELAHPATVQAGPAGIAVMGLELVRATDRLEAGGSGRVRVSGSLPWEAALARSRTDLEPRGGAGGSMPPAAAPVRRQRDVDFRVDLEQVPIAEFLHVARPAAAADGMLAGHITVRGTPAAPTLEGKLAITDLRYGDIALGRVEGSMGYRERRLEAQLELREGSSPVLSGRGTIPLDLSLAPVPDRRLAEPLDFVIQADALPAALPAAFLSAFRDVKGSVAGRLTIGGTTREPVLGGALELRQGAALWQPTGVAYRNVEGSFRVVGPRQVAVDLELRTDETSSAAGEAGRWSGRGGRASLEGAVTFRPLSDPELDLVLRGSQFLAARRRDVELAASGELHLQGSYRRPRVRTALRIDRGALYLDELWRQYQIVELDSPLLFDVVDTSAVAFRKILPASSSPFLKNLVASGSLDVGRDFWLRSRGLNVEVTGELTVAYDRRAEDRQPEDLRLWGTLSAVRGIYQVYGRRFEVRQGTVDFDGTPGIDPSLDITAGYRARTVQDQPLDIRAVVTGTLRSPRVALTSDAEPPISESDLASYLVFGRPTYLLAASESRALDLAGIGVFRAVAPSFLGYAASGLETFAQGFGLDYVAITAAETNLGEPQQGSAVSGLLGGAQVELGRYLGQNLFLAFTQRIGNAQRYSEPGVRLEWRFHPTWTAAAFAEDRFARNPAFGLEQGLELRKVYGFFLFRDWGY